MTFLFTILFILLKYYVVILYNNNENYEINNYNNYVWNIIPSDSNNLTSIGFYSNYNKEFICNSITCSNKPLENIVFHFVFGIRHISFFPLLVHRICLAFQQCIKPNNLFITMHSTLPTEELKINENFIITDYFLNSVDIKYSIDSRLFTSNNKTMISLEQLYNVFSKNKLI